MADPIELLPPAAADKLRMLRQRSDDAHAVTVRHSELQAQIALMHDAERALKRLTAHPSERGHNLPETDSRVVFAQQHLDKMAADLKRIQERSEARAAAWQTASQAKAAAEAWLKDGKPSGVLLQDYDGPEPALLKGENGLLDAIENRRRRVRELRADLHRIESEPFPWSYAKQRMREQIEQLAMQAPSVSSLIEHDGKIEFQTQRVQSEVYAERRSLAFTETADAIALTCWLHKSALIAALDREIDSEADDKAALSHEARQKAEAEVMGDLLAIEREEAWWVWRAQNDGLPCEHRADISPLALLGLRLVTTPRVNEPPGTSPGLSWPWRR